tara:strand:+ start:1854 stop:2243 length:390 start_codon:yes stop_codon:yes gene_type:complete
MAIGLAPKLPLSRSEIDGFYGLTKNIVENTQQNLKNLVLTSPGEKMMDPEFGVGIRRLLFESRESVISEAAGRIQEQVDTYMPYIEILDIVVAPREEDITISNEHTLFLGIEYIILPISLTDRVAIEVG